MIGRKPKATRGRGSFDPLLDAPAPAIEDCTEWIEPDGLGGFASGTATGINTRRYHALLLVSRRPPTERFVLVNSVEAWLEIKGGTARSGATYPLSSQRYAPGVTHPLGWASLSTFRTDPWPVWIYSPTPDVRVRHERVVRHGEPTVLLTWTLLDPIQNATLFVRPLISGRDYHALHHANASFRFDADVWGGRVQWDPYPDVPSIVAVTNGDYDHRPDWYRSFQYDADRDRGQDCVEDLATPGVISFDLSAGEGVLVLSTRCDREPKPWTPRGALSLADRIREAEYERRKTLASPLVRAADAYIARRQPTGDHPPGTTILAGYPWFTDWGRDTFISLRGLCHAPGAERLDDARDILLTWAALVSEGMLPNRLPDHGGEPEYNAVDASLWFIVTACEYLARAKAAGHGKPEDRRSLLKAMDAIIQGYSRGTRYNIGLDKDGLIRSGVEGVQLTWMDAKVGDWVVTPRIGKPVEIQALWLNALHAHRQIIGEEHPAFSVGMDSFARRFWRESRGWLSDVVDVSHNPGQIDESFRPNQVYAVGGLPLRLLDEAACRRVVDEVEARLVTPCGLRTLAPDSSGYRGRYVGDVWSRDGAYHTGTVWPYLLGPFVEAWVRCRGSTPEAIRQARERFLRPMLDLLWTDGVGHLSEIADGDPPHTRRGCPFQAWSVAEMLRLDRDILAIDAGAESRSRKKA